MNSLILTRSNSLISIRLRFIFLLCTLFGLYPNSTTAQNTFEKKGITFEVITYIRKGVEQDIRGDYPVIYVDNIDSRVISANYSFGGKTYTLNSFNGRLQSAFNQVKVTEMHVVGSLADGSMKIDACFERNSKHGNNISNIKKGAAVNIVHRVMNICKVSGLEELNSKIRELEVEEKQKQDMEQQPKEETLHNQQEQQKVEQVPGVQKQSQQSWDQKSTSSNTNSNQTNTQKQAPPTVNYTDVWNKQVQQDQQNLNQSIDNFSNTVSEWAENKRQERLEEQERQEQREQEAYNREINLLNKVNRRKAIVNDFPAQDIPLGSMESAQRLYYFVYAYDNLNSEYTFVFVSNVFEIGKYADGTRAYTTTVKREIENLTPYPEILHGYYYSQEEAEEALTFLIDGLKNSGVSIRQVVYKGKLATGTATNTTIENKNSKYEKVIDSPANIDTQPTNGVTPNNRVNKASTNKDEKIIK
jgi:hypothetical protein